MMIVSSRSTFAVVASSSAVFLTWKLLKWRARKRAQTAADRSERMTVEGPLIDCGDTAVCRRILQPALKRASKWMSYQSDAKPMVGQVGGVSVHKRPLLTLAPDYVLKPLHTDHRGVREVCFYELLQMAGSPNCSVQAYAARITGRKDPESEAWWRQFGEKWDAIAIWLAILLQDEAVAASERTLNNSWKAVRREMDSLRKLSNFTAPYYGVVRQKFLLCPSPSNLKSTLAVKEDSTDEILSDGHLLLQDVTANFSKPCVIDLKMGTQSYEPDATEEKRAQEFSKYQQQARFGFRIVGMRFYEPTHPEADDDGFRFFRKEFGRSLASRESVRDAFRLFFSAGITDPPTESNAGGGVENMRCRSVTNLLQQIRLLSRWFEENKSIAFYSSSLLVVYEGDVSVGTNRDVTNVKMIDFGRVRRDVTGDPGYKTGLRTIREIFTELLDEERHRLGSQ